MAIVVRVATDAESRATRAVGDATGERVDVLERVNRIVAQIRWIASRSRTSSRPSSMTSPREFQITLVSMYLPVGRKPTDDGRCRRLPEPVPRHRYRRRHHRARPPRPSRPSSSPDVLADPDYRAARDDVRSEVAAPVVHSGELLGVVNFEGTLEHPDRLIPGRPRRDDRATRCRQRSGRPGSTTNGAIACTPSNASSRSVDRSSPISTGHASWPRSSTLLPSCLAPMSSPSSRDSTTGRSSSRPAKGSRWKRSGPPPCRMTGSSLVPSLRASASSGSRRSPAWPPQYLAGRPGGTMPARAMALPIQVGNEIAAVLLIDPHRCRSDVLRARARHRRPS